MAESVAKGGTQFQTSSGEELEALLAQIERSLETLGRSSSDGSGLLVAELQQIVADIRHSLQAPSL